MTSRLVVNNIENDTGVTTVRLNPTYQAFELDSAERMRIDSTGRISSGKHGVGTYNDASEWFKVQSNDSAANISIVGSNDTHSSLNLGDEDDFNIQKIRSDHTNNSLQFFTDNTEKLRIDSNGFVSIGTDTPNVSGNDTSGYVGLSVVKTTGNRRGFIEIGDNQNADTGGIGDINFVGHYQDANHKVMASVNAFASGGTSGQRGAELQFKTKANGISGWPIERLRITSGGGVKFMSADSPTSTTEPAQWLNHSGGMQLYASSGSSTHRNIIFCSASNAASERMRIKSDGSVGIGTNSPDVDNRPGLHLYTTHSDSCRLNFETPSKPNSRIGYFGLNRFGMDVCNGFEIRDAADSFETRFMISSNGTCLFNTTSTTISNGNWGTSIQDGRFKTAHNVGSANVVLSVVGSSSGDGFRVMGDGDCENNNNSYTATSDERLKQDIVDAASQWDDIKAVKVKKYRFKSNPSGPLHIGVIAQDLQSVSPGLVKEVVPDDDRPDEKVKTVKYSILYMKAIKALQEAMARIETLETKVAALESS